MRHFFSELEQLEREIVEMGRLVKANVQRSVRCLTEGNADLADQVVRQEALINQAEVTIDDLATRLVSLNQPVASDMRLLIAALKITTDLERMGDLAVSTAQRALTLIDKPPLSVPIPAMSELVQTMLEKCMTAFANKDAALARAVLVSDDEVDFLRNRIFDELTQKMEEDASVVRTGLAYLFIARNLERIADHATNIAEDVVFLVKGIDVRHRRESQV